MYIARRAFRPFNKIGLFALLAALIAVVAASTTAGAAMINKDKGGNVLTSTGVRTNGSIKTTQYNVGWLLRCKLAETKTDDPIVHPDMPGMAHNHDFFGNAATNANSTYASMVASKTACMSTADTAAYWQPTLRELVGGTWQTVAPDTTGQQIYYRGRYAKGVVVSPMPPDLRITTGNAMATTVADNPALQAGNVHWECTGGDDTEYTTPQLGCGRVVEEIVAFPSCWDGQLTHSNDTAHVAYAPDMGRCPAAFPIAMPRISLRVKFRILPGTTAFALASGSTATAHADFWNTWQQSGLSYLVDHCINAKVSCGTNPIAPMG